MILFVALLSATLAGATAVAQPGRDMLWHIVSECLDPSSADYCQRCRAPLQGYCSSPRECERTTEVWAESADYVAVRDLKMCGCPMGFVHGLALPRLHIKGIEDVHRPAGLWAFAWHVARQRIADEREIALVVNPPDVRTQDQLHVHLVRVKPEARPAIAARAARIASLDEVWQAAARQAAGATDHGVLVLREPSGGFQVFTEKEPLERRYTVAECR